MVVRPLLTKSEDRLARDVILIQGVDGRSRVQELCESRGGPVPNKPDGFC